MCHVPLDIVMARSNIVGSKNKIGENLFPADYREHFHAYFIINRKKKTLHFDARIEHTLQHLRSIAAKSIAFVIISCSLSMVL